MYFHYHFSLKKVNIHNQYAKKNLFICELSNARNGEMMLEVGRKILFFFLDIC
jgi:hypothetical protein